MERTSHSSNTGKGEAALSSTENASISSRSPRPAGGITANAAHRRRTDGGAAVQPGGHVFVQSAECTHTDSRRYGSLSPFLMMTAVSNLRHRRRQRCVSRTGTQGYGRRTAHLRHRLLAEPGQRGGIQPAVRVVSAPAALSCGADAEVYPVAAAYARWTLLWGRRARY